MLQEKLSAAEASLATCDEDLDFLREQITVCLFFIVLRSIVAIAFPLFKTGTTLILYLADAGSRHSPGLQLGRCAEEERKC